MKNLCIQTHTFIQHIHTHEIQHIPDIQHTTNTTHMTHGVRCKCNKLTKVQKLHNKRFEQIDEQLRELKRDF